MTTGFGVSVRQRCGVTGMARSGTPRKTDVRESKIFAIFGSQGQHVIRVFSEQEYGPVVNLSQNGRYIQVDGYGLPQLIEALQQLALTEVPVPKRMP